jgi:hypothetical protein
VSGTVNVGNFPEASQGRLIDLGTQSHTGDGDVAFPIVNVDDCNKLTAGAVFSGSNVGSQLSLRLAGTVDGGAHEFSIPRSFGPTGVPSGATDTVVAVDVVFKELRVYGVMQDSTGFTNDITAWIWCEP